VVGMKVTYYELDKREIGKETEKAIGIITGTKSDLKTAYKYIAKSLIKEVENKLYIPTWIVKQEGLWDYIKEENQIQIDNGKKVTRRSAEQIVKDKIQKEISFNKEMDIESYMLIISFGNDVQSNEVRQEIAEKKINKLKNRGLEALQEVDKVAMFYINNNQIQNYILNELDDNSNLVYEYVQSIL
jgi:hypothetical protein